jgi:hypothetical protein
MQDLRRILFAGIDHARRAKFLGHRQPLGAEVGDVDLRAAQHLQRLLGKQTDRTRADDEHRRRRIMLREVHDVDAVRERLGQRGGFGGEILRPRDQTARGDVDVLRKRAWAVHAKDLAVRAEMGVTARAAHAPAAGHERVAHDARAFLPVLHVRPELGDRTAKFMTHHQRGRAARAVVLERLEFTPAHAARGDLQPDLVGLRRRDVLVADFQLVEGRVVQDAHGRFSGVPADAHEGKAKPHEN